MSHPVDANGDPVCANQPSVLEAYQIGFIFNTGVKNRKLVTEAWVDNERAANLNDESRVALEALQAGEVVEVSTGLYTTVVEKEGRFNGESYSGVWEGIVPDHLAILPTGVIGACSVEDGCGTNRASQNSPHPSNSGKARNVPPLHVVGSAPTPFTAAEMRSNAWRNSIPKTNGCGCGTASCTCGDHAMPDTTTTANASGDNNSILNPSSKRKSGKAISYPVGTTIEEVAGSCPPGAGGEWPPNEGTSPYASSSWFTKLLSAAGIEVKPEYIREASKPPELDRTALLANRIWANAAPGTMLSSDVSMLLSDALSDAYSGQPEVSAYYLGHTADKVIYTAIDWNSSSYSGDMFQCSYEISEDGSSVTLAQDDEEVNLITQVVRVADQTGDGDDVTRDQRENSSAPEGSNTESEVMTQSTAGGGKAPTNTQTANAKKDKTVTEQTDSATVHGTPDAVDQVTEALDAGGATGKAHSLDQLLDNATPALKGAIKASMRVYERQKAALIAGIKANARNRYTDERLNAMELEDLEALAELANVPRYDGIAPAIAPSANQSEQMVTYGQRANNGLGVPTIEPAFPRTPAANAA
jgi:hypothetical protein